MNDVLTAVSLIDWKFTLLCAVILALIIVVFSVIFTRILAPTEMRIMTKCLTLIIGLLMVIEASSNPDIIYMGNSVYAVLAILIVLVMLLLYYFYDKIAAFFWNYRADKINK